MDKLFDEFLMEKEYVADLSKVTLKGYKVTWRTFKRIIKEPTISRETFFQFTKQMMDEGLQTRACIAQRYFIDWSRINELILIISYLLDWSNELSTAK